MQKYIEKLGYKTIPGDFYSKIEEWENWYKGKIESFHRYNQYNGKKLLARERATLGMAKKVCEDWANLLLNEKVVITTDSENVTKRLCEILDENNFKVKANQLIELSFALGTGAFVEYIDENKSVKIDYIKADMIYPLSWDNKSITECAFASEMVIENKKCIYLQLHILHNGKYVIQNKLFEKDGGKEVPLPKNIKPEFYTNSSTPLFQIIMPNIINSYDLSSPMGMSVFANSIDILKGIDLVYDSYQNEFRLGKKRIIVPVGMAQLNSDETGLTPVFDDNDTEFYAIKSNDKLCDLKEINMELRSEQHKEALRENINILSDKCGLGSDRYKFDQNGVKTATEIISDKSSLFQNLKKHEITLNKALCDMSKALLFLDMGLNDISVNIDFDDSIIEDTNTDFTRNMQLVSAGIMSKTEFRMWWMGETEKQAGKALKAIDDESEWNDEE